MSLEATPTTGAAARPAAVHGTVAQGFDHVREVFAAVLAAEPGHAAQVAAYVDGRPVVDLWGGPGMAEDSLIGVFSSTKGAAHLSVALLVQDGTLSLDKEVRHYWPEFAAEGKDRITLRELLSHRAGVVNTDTGFSPAELADDRLVAERLAGQRPYWRPGTHFGYHALVIGALTGELVRRTTGLTMQQFYDRQIRDARGVDLFMGLPEEYEHRVLDVLPQDPTPEQERELAETWHAPDSLDGIAFNEQHPDNPPLHGLPNLRVVRAGGPASVGGVGTARGLARMYAAAISTVDGKPPLLTPRTAAEFAQPHSTGYDIVLRQHMSYALGFTVTGDGLPFLGAGTFGHDGAGGSMGFADPRAGLTFGYVRRRFPFPGGAGPDGHRLAEAVRQCTTGRGRPTPGA